MKFKVSQNLSFCLICEIKALNCCAFVLKHRLHKDVELLNKEF